MNLTILLFELFGIVFLFSILMFYAGVNYNKYKIAGFIFHTPQSVFTDLFSQKQNKNSSLKINHTNNSSINQNDKVQLEKTIVKNKNITITKLSITPRMTIYKTIDEE